MIPGECASPLESITAFETERENTKESKHAADCFQNNRKILSEHIPAKSLEIFDSFAKEYSKAVKAYVILKQDKEEQAKAAAEKLKKQEDAAERQAQAEREKKKDLAKQQNAAEESRIASLTAEEATKAKAIQKARAAQQEERAKQLAECLESPAYKLWQASLEVVAGKQMIQKAQSLMDHDNAVTRESNVSDLAERRVAGEDIVAGKRLVAKAFADYKQLGGTANTPEEVVPGPDPAAQYR